MRISTSAWRRRPASGVDAESLIVRICVVPTSPLRPGRTPTILPLNRCGPARLVSDGPIGTMGRGKNGPWIPSMEVLLLQELFRLRCVPVLCSSAPRYGDLRWYHFTGLQDTVSQWHSGMAKAQERCQGNADGRAMGNGRLEEHRCGTAHLHTVARLECGGDVAGRPAESATTDRAALAVCAGR